METMNSIELPNLDEEICIICESPIQKTDKKMEYICGCHTVHTGCGLRHFCDQFTNYGIVRCDTCSQVVYENYLNNHTDTNSITNDDNTQSEEFKHDLKNIKLKRRNVIKPVQIFRKKLSDDYLKYKEAIQVYIATLKLTHKETIKSIKQSNEYKSAVSAIRSYKLSINKFRIKYNIRYSILRKMKLNFFINRYSDPSFGIKRRFMIRIG
jgi:hypothetical protein